MWTPCTSTSITISITRLTNVQRDFQIDFSKSGSTHTEKKEFICLKVDRVFWVSMVTSAWTCFWKCSVAFVSLEAPFFCCLAQCIGHKRNEMMFTLISQSIHVFSKCWNSWSNLLDFTESRSMSLSISNYFRWCACVSIFNCVIYSSVCRRTVEISFLFLVFIYSVAPWRQLTLHNTNVASNFVNYKIT